MTFSPEVPLDLEDAALIDEEAFDGPNGNYARALSFSTGQALGMAGGTRSGGWSVGYGHKGLGTRRSSACRPPPTLWLYWSWWWLSRTRPSISRTSEILVTSANRPCGCLVRLTETGQDRYLDSTACASRCIAASSATGIWQ